MTDEENRNPERAYELLDEAMYVSKRVKQKDIEKGEVEWEKVYPTSKEETERMESLLGQAKQAATDPEEPAFKERYGELSDIVEYSKKRHRKWMWSLIGGALLGAAIFWYMSDDSKKDMERAQKELAVVENWAESDTTISYKNCPDNYHNLWNDRKLRASKYKAYRLAQCKNNVNDNNKWAAGYKSQADTCKDEKRKAMFLDDVKRCEEKAVQERAMYDSINAMGFAQIKEMAVEDFKNTAKWREEDHGSNQFYLYYLLILIPLYIITGYPRGYTITRHRLQSGCLNGFRKVGFGIAAFCFGAGVAMALLPDYIVEKTYASGRKETSRETNVLNGPIIALKFMLMIAGAIIFIFVSAMIMTIETVLGIFQNYEWKEIFASIKAKTSGGGKVDAKLN